MENMDLDLVIDIPDTPDRVGVHRINGREGMGKESVSSGAGYSRNFHLVDEDCCNQLGDRGKGALESGKIMKRPSLHTRKDSSSEVEIKNGLRASGDAPLFRRTTVVEKDKGKGVCSKFQPRSSGPSSNDPVINLNERNGCNNLPEKARPCDGAKSSSLYSSGSSVNEPGITKKGKEKIDDKRIKVAGSVTLTERIDLSSEPQRRKDDGVSSFDQPNRRVAGHRRLVRNGCISPHGIAARAKQLAEHNHASSKDSVTERSCTEKAASCSPSMIDIRDIIMEDSSYDRAKGKGAITPPHTSKDNEAQTIDVPSRDGSRETSGSKGWRRVNRQVRIGHPLPDRIDPSLRVGARRTFSLILEADQTREHTRDDRIVLKRQSKSEFTSTASKEPQISAFGSSGESSSSRPSIVPNRQRRGMLDPVCEVDDSSPKVRLGRVEGTGHVDNDESDARARQVEADEMLARELQEQLYHDVSVFGDGEIDENIAWALQQEESSLHASSSQNHRHLYPISRVPSSRRQTRSRLMQNSSTRRAATPRANASVRMTRPRSNPFSRSRAGFPRAWNLHFPNDMDLESRLDMLEELESAAEGLGGAMNRMNHLSQFQDDFNENDYEMLLALDENNHRHAGASVHQINSLPQSTVQSDNIEEACAICLETLTKGDVIRHLPCLHKFHKDCIDPWLGRSKSCPVCKSSVT